MDSNDEKLRVRIAQQANRELKKLQFCCLFPNCSRHAVGCHSQWKKGVLASLAESNQVYAFHDNFVDALKNQKQNRPQSRVKQVSIGKATIFQGYCNKHDSRLFLPIESGELSPDSNIQAWCLHLRALSHAFIRKQKCLAFLQAISRLQQGHTRQVYDTASLLAKIQEETHRISLYKEFLLDPLFVSGSEKSVGYIWRTIPTVLPVSNVSVFCPVEEHDNEMVFLHNPEARFAIATFNLLPMADRTEIVITYNDVAEQHIVPYMKELFCKNCRRLARFVNRLVFNYSEDFCVSPSFWDSISERHRGMIQNHLTVIRGKEQYLQSLPIIPSRFFRF